MKATMNLEKWIWVKFFQTQPWFVGKKLCEENILNKDPKTKK